MVRIPQYYSQTSVQNPGGGRRASASDFGGDQGLSSISQGLQAVSNVAFSIGEEEQRKQAAAYVTEQSSQLQLDKLKRLQEIRTDGGDINTLSTRFEQEFDEDLNARIAAAPNEVAKTALMQQGTSLKTSLTARAVAMQAEQKIAMAKQSSALALQNVANSIFLDPDNYEKYRVDAAKIYTNAPYLSEAERDGFKQSVNTQIAEAKIRAEIDRNPENAAKLLREPEFANSLKTDDLMRLDNTIKTIQLKQRQEFKNNFISNPAKIAVDAGANTPQSIIEYQRNIGVADGNISIIPNDEAKTIVNQFNGITNSDQLVQQLRSIQQKVGVDYYNMAMKDLKKNGLSDQMAFAATMNPVQDKRIMDATLAYAKDKDEIKSKAMAIPDVTIPKIQEVVYDKLRDSLQAIAEENPFGQAQTGQLINNMTGVATYFVAQGNSIEDSAELATEWFNNKSGYGTFNDIRFRVPLSYNPDDVENAVEKWLDNIKFSDIEFEQEVLRDRSSLVLHPDQTKYYLKDEIGNVVTDSKGETIFIPINDALEAEQKRIMEFREKAARDAAVNKVLD